MTTHNAVTIIVPVYNAAEYLADSLDSALQQTYPEIEVICVNDGSTDRSSELLNQISNQNPSVGVHHFQQNRGASAARNKGLELALGDYVFFLDADDSLPERAIENLVSAAAQTGSDLVLGRLEWLKEAGGIQPTPDSSGSSGDSEITTSTARSST